MPARISEQLQVAAVDPLPQRRQQRAVAPPAPVAGGPRARPPHQVMHARELAMLQEMGFPQREAATALDLAGGSLDGAVMLITSGQIGAMMEQRDGRGMEGDRLERPPVCATPDGAGVEQEQEPRIGGLPAAQAGLGPESPLPRPPAERPAGNAELVEQVSPCVHEELVLVC